MRKKFQQELTIYFLPISDVKIPNITRDELPPVLKALQTIFITPELNKEVFKLLESEIKVCKMGRPGMDLWQILVLAVIRNSLNTNYDRILDLANNHKLIRQIMGIGTMSGFEYNKEFSLSSIKDNVSKISEDTIISISDLVVKYGHDLVKKKDENLRTKTDTFVAEVNVHFPTDINLLYDSGRKCLSIIEKAMLHINIKGWREIASWGRKLKSISRECIFIQAKGGKNKMDRLQDKAAKYIEICKKIEGKVEKTLLGLIEFSDPKKMDIFIQLEDFYQMLKLHIDLVTRRIINGEKIPNSEKLYSIFERHTEWLQKGKQGNKVELGHKVLITTDQFQFIVYHKVIEKQADSDLTIETADALLNKFPQAIESFSADKGFFKKEDIPLLESEIKEVVIPKKGKKTLKETEKEKEKKYIKCRNSHSAVESNINQLEANGLDRCPDKGLKNFKRYTAMAVLSYNLNILGKMLINNCINKKNTKIAA